MKVKKKISHRPNPKIKSIPLIIFLLTFVLSVGYATINSINLDISGTTVAYNETGIVIEEVKYLNSNNADTSNSKINQITGPVLNSTIALSPSDASSSITYQITIINLNEYDCRFIQTIHESAFYDNSNIEYSLDGLSIDTVLKSNERITFNITFKYKSGVTPSTSINTLNSYIYFDFELEETVIGNYAYTGNYQTFTAPETGFYKIELWGAAGGKDMLQGILYENTTGLGGYTSGFIELEKGDSLYIYVGGKGEDAILEGNSKGGYNGGGDASFDKKGDDESSGAGGGATDVRLVAGEWNNETSLKSRIMVAGGGASERVWKPSSGILANYVSPYCAAGGLSGYTMVSTSSPGTQTSGYAFGYGESRVGGSSDAGDGGSDSGLNGGGGGYWGGTSGDTNYYDIAAGGSSFISGHNGCVAIISETSLTPRNDSTGSQCADGTTDITCSFHYSNKVFEDTIMIDGAGFRWTTEKEETVTGMPTIDGTGIMTGNNGNGHAKITIVETIEEVECPNDGKICDISGNNNHINIVGATWDKASGEISTDGVNDYLYIDMLEWNDTTEFSIEFYAQLIGCYGVFFESSINSNNNYGSFYINSGEYGTKDLNLAMKFTQDSNSRVVHHHNVDNFIDINNFHHYVITFNSNNAENSYIRMYKDGIQYQTTKVGGITNISGHVLKNYPFYISSRAGVSSISKMKLKTLRIYLKELTLDEVRTNYNGANPKRDDLLASFDFNK